MNCARCKTVELIRVEWLPMNLAAPWEYISPPVDRCPCCGLEWAVQPSKSMIGVTGRPGRGKRMTAAEYLQEQQLQQLDMFSLAVGGFVLNDTSEP